MALEINTKMWWVVFPFNREVLVCFSVPTTGAEMGVQERMWV